MSYDITPTVQAIGQMNFDGNIVPMEWFQHIRFENGKPDTNAILILSDIVYWYRPTKIRDEQSGQVIGCRKKFKSDLLQKNYQDYANLLGLSKRQVMDAFVRLEQSGVIRRVFRSIETGFGTTMNVLFIDLNPLKLAQINASVGGPTIERGTPHVETCHPPRQNVIPPTLKRGTYTNTTPNITTNISLSPLPPCEPKREVKASLSKASPIEAEKNEREKNNLILMLKIFSETVLDGRELALFDERKVSLKAVLDGQLCGDLSKWSQVCRNIASSRFLMGEAETSSFKASLDWVLEGYNASKILEGASFGIGDRQGAAAGKTPNPNEIITRIETEIEDPHWRMASKWLAEALSPSTYAAWFGEVKFERGGEGVVLVAPSNFIRDRLRAQYISHIESALRFADSTISRVRIMNFAEFTQEKAATQNFENDTSFGRKAREGLESMLSDPTSPRREASLLNGTDGLEKGRQASISDELPGGETRTQHHNSTPVDGCDQDDLAQSTGNQQGENDDRRHRNDVSRGDRQEICASSEGQSEVLDDSASGLGEKSGGRKRLDSQESQSVPLTTSTSSTMGFDGFEKSSSASFLGERRGTETRREGEGLNV